MSAKATRGLTFEDLSRSENLIQIQGAITRNEKRAQGSRHFTESQIGSLRSRLGEIRASRKASKVAPLKAAPPLPPLPSAPSSNESSSSARSKTRRALQKITNMGFSNVKARNALAKTGNIKAALEILMQPSSEEEVVAVSPMSSSASSSVASPVQSRAAKAFKEMIEAHRRVAKPFTPYMPVVISGGTGNGPCMYNSVFRALSYHPFADLTKEFKMPRTIRGFLNEYVFTKAWEKKYEYTYYAIKGTKEQKRAVGINSAMEELVKEEIQAYQPDFVKTYFKKGDTSLKGFIEMVKGVKMNPSGNSETWGSNEEFVALRESLKAMHNIVLLQYSPKGKLSEAEKHKIVWNLEQENGIDITGLELKSRGENKPQFARFFHEENTAALDCDGKPVHPCDIPARLQINVWYNGKNHYEALIPKGTKDEKILLTQ
jgi:hypothetical protein